MQGKCLCQIIAVFEWRRLISNAVEITDILNAWLSSINEYWMDVEMAFHSVSHFSSDPKSN